LLSLFLFAFRTGTRSPASAGRCGPPL
jgi:hypothetical protein